MRVLSVHDAVPTKIFPMRAGCSVELRPSLLVHEDQGYGTCRFAAPRRGLRRGSGVGGRPAVVGGGAPSLRTRSWTPVGDLWRQLAAWRVPIRDGTDGPAVPAAGLAGPVIRAAVHGAPPPGSDQAAAMPAGLR